MNRIGFPWLKYGVIQPQSKVTPQASIFWARRVYRYDRRQATR